MDRSGVRVAGNLLWIRGCCMASGTVVWFSASKGYGFISQDDGSPDVFVHYSSIPGEGFRMFREGQRVTYEVVNGDKGLRAENIALLEEDSAPPASPVETSQRADEDAGPPQETPPA